MGCRPFFRRASSRFRSYRRRDLRSIRAVHRAGAVAAGGILSMLNALPLIFASVAGSLRDMHPVKRPAEPVWPARIAICPCRWFWRHVGLVLAIALSHLIPTEFTGRLIGAGHDRACSGSCL